MNCKTGDNIRLAREEAKMSQTDLAQAIGTTQSQIGKYERGEQVPTIDRMIEISAALGINTGELLKYDGSIEVEYFVNDNMMDCKRQVFIRANSDDKKILQILVEKHGTDNISIAQRHPTVSAPLMVAYNIRQYRRISKMTVAQLAQRSGLSIDDIEWFESGKANVEYDKINENTQKLDIIAAVFNLVGSNGFFWYGE